MVGGPVTVTASYPVAPGEEGAFHAWAMARLAESEEEPGYLRGEVRAPARPGPNWLIVHHFRDEDAALDWEQWFRRSPGAAQAVDVTWEHGGPAVPTRSRPAPPPPPPRDPSPPQAPPPALEPAPSPPARPVLPPPKWKMAVVTLGAVFPPVLLFNVTLVPALGDYPVVIRSAALCVGVTVLTTWVMMPRLTRWLKRWLHPLTGRHRRSLPPTGPPTDRRAPPRAHPRQSFRVPR